MITQTNSFYAIESDLIDTLIGQAATLGECLVVLTIVKETIETGEDDVKISYNQFQAKTGLGTHTIALGIKYAVIHGLIEQWGGSQGRTYSYRLVV